jgi:hypothetical protein
MNIHNQLRSDIGNAVGTVVVPISVPGLDVHPENLEEIASYNWLNERAATILVPGVYLTLSIARY